MSSERIVHSERTNGALPSGEMGTNSGDKEIEGRWMKRGHRRQRVAYNWRNNRQEFVLGDAGRKKMLVYRACFEIIFPSKQKTLSFCCLQSCCVSSSQQCDVAVMPVATWCTCQELFRPTRQTAKRKSNTSYGISVSVLSLRGQRLFVLLSCPAIIIILVSLESK